jgi:hypothetical protein
VLEVDNGAAGQWGALKLGVRDAGTTTVTDGLTLGHQSTGTPAAGLGAGILFNINDSTTADVNAGESQVLWTTATHSSNVSDWVLRLDNGSTTLAEAFRIKGAGTIATKTQAAAPSSPVEGWIYTDSVTHKPYYYNGTSWLDLSVGAVAANFTGHGDSAYTILSTDRMVYTTATLTAIRIWTLPLANSITAGQSVTVFDAFKGTTSTNYIQVLRSGSDTLVNNGGGGSSTNVSGAGNGIILVSDGVSKWYIQPILPENSASNQGRFVTPLNAADVGWSVWALPVAGGAGVGQVITSNGATSANWSTATYPLTGGAAGNAITSDGTNFSSTDIGAWTILKVITSDATTTGQVFVDVTGLRSATLLASTKYEIEAVLQVATTADATGTQYAIDGGGSGTVATTFAQVSGNSSGANTSQTTSYNTIDSANGATFLTYASGEGVVVIKGFITTRGTAPATIGIQHLKVTSGTSTVRVGSVLKFRKA